MGFSSCRQVGQTRGTCTLGCLSELMVGYGEEHMANDEWWVNVAGNGICLKLKAVKVMLHYAVWFTDIVGRPSSAVTIIDHQMSAVMNHAVKGSWLVDHVDHVVISPLLLSHMLHIPTTADQPHVPPWLGMVRVGFIYLGGGGLWVMFIAWWSRISVTQLFIGCLINGG